MAEDSYWNSFQQMLHLADNDLLHVSPIDPGRRVYAKGNYIFKVVAKKQERTGSLRANDLANEFNFLKRCLAVPGIPRAVSYECTEDFEILTLQRLPGTSLEIVDVTWLQLIIILARLGRILLKLSCAGLSHNDIVRHNILIGVGFSVSLIDFDQATSCTLTKALTKNFLGIPKGECIVNNSVLTIVKSYLKKSLPAPVVIKLSRLRNCLKKKKMRQLPTLPENADFQLKMLYEAWRIAQQSDANSPGQQVAYYSLNIKKHYFPGERPWEPRWKVMQPITGFSEKRILELGCNMGLLSASLLKEAQASAVLAVDMDEQILEAAQCVSRAYGVEPDFKIVNLDSAEAWEDELVKFKPDIVFALNVLNWVQDKQRLLNFLGRFNELIFEGHDSLEIERERLQAVGFKVIEIIKMTERNRELLHCKK